jgi:ankyrin
MSSYSAAAVQVGAGGGKQRYVEPFFLCVVRGDLRYLVELLTKDPEAVNCREETGQTLLHTASALGQLEIVIYLLNRRDCNVCDQDDIYHHTPLHMACMYNQNRVAAELLKKLSSIEGSVCLQDKFGWTPLHHAARNGNVELCKLLVSHDCRPHIPNELGKTACHYAAEKGHLDVLKYLYDYVERMVSPPVIPDDGVPPTKPTLLHCAALEGRAEVVDWLQGRVYPPHTKCRRILDLDGRVSESFWARFPGKCPEMASYCTNC